jgi:hypothetical protein
MVSAAGNREDPFERLRRNIEGVPDEIEGTTAALARLNEQLAKGQEQPFLFNIVEFNALKGGVAQIERDIRDVQAAVAEASLQAVESTRSRVERIVQARLDAERDAVQAELQLQQAGFRLRDQQLRAAFDQEEITREQFFDRRIALAREAAGAEVAALRAERQQVAAAAVSEEQAPAQQAKLDALAAAIRLRQAELGIQLDQITAEEQRGRAAAALLPIERQLADLQAQRQATTQAGVGTVEFDTDQAEAQLNTLETQLQRLAAFADERPDLGFDTSEARENLDALRAQMLEVIRTGAEDTRIEFDTSLASAQLDALEAQARQAFLTARTEAERELALQAIVKIRTERTAEFQREVQRQIDALEFTVQLTADTTGAEREIRERLGIPIPLELDNQAAIAEATRLRDEIGRRIAAAGGQAKAAPVDVQEFERLTRAIQAALDAPFNALLDGADRAREALASGQAAIEAERLLIAGAGDPSASATDTAAALARLAPLVTAVENEYRKVTAQILSGSLSQDKLNAAVQEQLRLAEELRRIRTQQTVAVPAEFAPFLGPLEQAAKDLIDARRRFVEAQAAGAEGPARQAAQDAEEAAARLKDQRDFVLQLAAGFGLSAAQAEALYAAIARAMGLLGDGVTDAQRFAQALDGALGVLGAIQRFGGSTGIFSESDQRFLDALGGIGNTVGRFAAGDIFGGVISAIDTLGSIFGGGPSPAELALQANTAAVRQNTISRTTGFEGAGGAADAANIISQVLASELGRFLAGNTEAPGGTGRAFRDRLVAQLEGLGLSFEQLQRLANDFGVEILANGRIVGGALETLAEEMRAAAEAAFEFHEGLFEDEQRLAALRSRAQGTEQDPSEIFRQQLEAATAAGAGDLFGPLQDALNTGDADSIRQAILAMLDAWENNLIDIEDLGGLTREQWETILNSGLDAADAIDQLGSAAADAALEMSNIPRGFRQAALAFEAQDPTSATGTIGLKKIDVLAAGSDGDSLPQLVAAVERLEKIKPTTIFNVDIDGTNKNGDDLLDELLDAAERRAGAGGITFNIQAGR